MHAPRNIAAPCSQYDFNELAEIYNQTRIDYIVPMPMNGKRMKQYVTSYDINLDHSVVATTEDGDPIGIGMLGVRGPAAWITRLGVVPNQRERRVGSFLMTNLIDNARACNAHHIQLEVIVGNDPALNMFSKYGFEPTRELLVIRRPPRPHVEGTHPLVHELRELNDDEIHDCLMQREPGASWVEDTPSLLNAGSLKGIQIRMGENGLGWVVFMCTRFQIQHVVLHATDEHYHEIMNGLLYYMHELYPNRDTKVENVPSDHPTWRAYGALGYVIDFKRTEMVMTL
ncbi:MAG: GNAT family N-acetyltransferase [Chloroflexota bacterium]